MNNTFTPISSLGEFGLIERVKQIVESASDSVSRNALLKGISDDAAVFLPGEDTVQLVTTDAFTEGIHFDLTYTSPQHLGWKIMAANISDIAAMGGIPKYAVISLALPSKISVELVEQLYEGIRRASKQYSCLVIGGDTVSSPANMFISVTLIGETKKDAVAYRHGAKPGDILCVTGSLGGSHAGLKVLQREKARYIQSSEPQTFKPNLEPYTAALEKHLMPKPRTDIALLLAGQGLIHAMIDISDGLASEVHHICRASETGARIVEQQIPLDEKTIAVANELSENPVDYALFGGEDYELLFAIDEHDLPRAQSLTKDIIVVGKVTSASNGIELIKGDGEGVLLPFKGWNHFKG